MVLFPVKVFPTVSFLTGSFFACRYLRFNLFCSEKMANISLWSNHVYPNFCEIDHLTQSPQACNQHQLFTEQRHIMLGLIPDKHKSKFLRSEGLRSVTETRCSNEKNEMILQGNRRKDQTVRFVQG